MSSKRSIKIVCPSYKRAGRVKAVKLFNKLTLAVHECERDEYMEAYPDNPLIVIPDHKRGNMAKVRNHILNQSQDHDLLMIDDDVRAVVYNGDSEKANPNSSHVDKEILELDTFIVNAFTMMRELGTILWGINPRSDPRNYGEYSPLSFLSPVCGTFMGIGKTSVRFDEGLGLNEDYDFALQVLQKYHKVLRFNKYSYLTNHLTQEGGCGAWRTMKAEHRQAEIMIKKWGRVVSYDFEKTVNPSIRVPLKGI